MSQVLLSTSTQCMRTTSLPFFHCFSCLGYVFLIISLSFVHRFLCLSHSGFFAYPLSHIHLVAFLVHGPFFPLGFGYQRGFNAPAVACNLIFGGCHCIQGTPVFRLLWHLSSSEQVIGCIFFLQVV